MKIELDSASPSRWKRTHLHDIMANSAWAIHDNLDMVTSGYVEGLKLSGNYTITLYLTTSDTRNLLNSIIRKDPMDAIKLFAELQAEAQIALAEQRAG